MIVVLDLDDNDVPAVVEAIDSLPRRPSRLALLTDHSNDGERVREVLIWPRR